MDDSAETSHALEQDRLEVLNRLQDWLETPMIVLGFFWLVLLVIELIWGLSPFLGTVSNVIWGIFILDFILKITVAPRKLRFLRDNWLTEISLLLPALRVFRLVRVFRLARATRGLRLVKVIGSLNRGMRAAGTSFGRRGFGYIAALTLIVVLVGAAGMYAFERNVPGGGLDSYGEALWWTSMILTTLGSEYWPKTAEGRVLCVILSLYGFAVFGYITASLSSFFIDQDASSDSSDVASAGSIQALRDEIRALRAELHQAQPRS